MPSDLTQVFQQYTDAWNSHDAAAIIATFEAGGTYNDPVTPGPLTGEAIGVYAKGLWDAFPDLSFETLSSIENGNGLLAAQWLMKGTNTGSMNGLPPTGKSISLRGADFVSVEGGRSIPSKATSMVARFHARWGSMSSCSPRRLVRLSSA